MKEGKVFLDFVEDEPPPRLPEPVFKRGDLCGAYEIDELIARGGSADVYRARHLFLGVQRAIKIARHYHRDQSSLRRRFVREARSVVVIDHPYVVKILDGGEHDGRAWIGMELIVGELLRRSIIVGRPTPIVVALRRFVKICEGVAAVHRHRLIHRDLKPENIMLSGDRPTLLDFGISKKLDLSVQMRTTGQVRGTPAYMAPEYLLSVMDEVSVDERADLYSLGHILYEMFLGRHAYSNPDGTFPSKVELMRRHLEPAHGRIAPLPDLLEGFPEYVWSELEKTLRRDPSDRPRGAQELGSNFGALLTKYQHERLERDDFYDALQSRGLARTQPSKVSTLPVRHGGSATVSSIETSRPGIEDDTEPDGVPVPSVDGECTSVRHATSNESGGPALARPRKMSDTRVQRPVSLARIVGLVVCGVALSLAVVGLVHVVAAARRATHHADPTSDASLPAESVRFAQRTRAEAAGPLGAGHVPAIAPPPVLAPPQTEVVRSAASTSGVEQPASRSAVARRAKQQPRPGPSATLNNVRLPYSGLEEKPQPKRAGQIQPRVKPTVSFDADDKALF